MKIQPKTIARFVAKIFEELKDKNQIIFKEEEAKVFDRATQIVLSELQKEIDLDREVNKMLDDLERQHRGEFQRYKMHPLLKRKLAKEKGIIL